MENHPIPQDITNFQFKLIGDMTIKQFAYLAAGSVLAWILFAVHITAVIKLPLALFFFMTGFSLAFVPLEGRPLDTMLSLFIKALFTPNQYIYKKEAGQIAILHISAKNITKQKTPKSSSFEKLQALLQRTGHNSAKNKLDEKEMVFFESLSGFYTPFPSVQNNAYAAPVVNQPAPEKKQNTEMEKETSNDELIMENEEKIIKEQADNIKKELEAAKKIESLQKETKNFQDAHEKVTELESLLQSAMADKQRLEKQLELLSQKLNNQDPRIFSPSMANLPKTQNVKTVPKTMAHQTGVPIVPEIPNILSGVVKDARGNILVNILIEVKDKDGNPVRAFKTNSHLGSFHMCLRFRF